MQLSKSEYMMFLRHPAWLWLKKHDKFKLPPVDDNTQAMFDAGNLFERYAEQLFPDAFKIGFSSYDSYLTLPQRTHEAFGAGHATLLQGRLEAEGITCIFDLVTVVSDKLVDLYEIKSSTEVKTDHVIDLSFQQCVFEAAGYQVRKLYVIHVNNQYVRDGAVDVSALTNIEDVTEAVKELQEQTKLNIGEALSVANSSTRPDISPALAGHGAFKDWLDIYRILAPIGPDSLYELAGITSNQVAELEALGIRTIRDIPADFLLTERQALQVRATKENRVLIDAEKIQEFLGGFQYPLYFLDYETMSSVVPHFDGTRPWQQIPFQYSVHILDAPGAELRHATYLHRENSNPAQALGEALQRDIGPKGTVLAWFMGFEKACNTTLGTLAPEYKAFYEQLNDRIVDLMVPFSSGWYVDKAFLGSASIKKVLPVLVPELSYQTLAIHEGGMAQRLWMQAVLDGSKADQKEQILKNLDEYCTLDTLAMVKIFEKLQAI